MVVAFIVPWLAVYPEFGWSLLGLFCGSLLLRRLAPTEGRRIGFVWTLSLAALLLWLAAGLPSSPRWAIETVRALLELIGLYLAAVLVFHVVLNRWRAPRLLSDLIIVAGYLAIRIPLLHRLAV